MFAEERRAEIAKLVASARRVNGADLARRYDVTMETVRRDHGKKQVSSAVSTVVLSPLSSPPPWSPPSPPDRA